MMREAFEEVGDENLPFVTLFQRGEFGGEFFDRLRMSGG
jgi:hypothetical protein